MFTKEYGNGPMLIRHANFFPMLHLLLPIPKLETRFDVPLKMPLESLLQLGLGRPRRVKDHYAIGLDQSAHVQNRYQDTSPSCQDQRDKIWRQRIQLSQITGLGIS
jgi:hypothetical protein